MYGLKALTVTGAGTGLVTDLGLTGAGHTQAVFALGDILYFNQEDDGTSTLMGVQNGEIGWNGNVAIQKNNILVGSPASLLFMAEDGIVNFVMYGDGSINDHLT